MHVHVLKGRADLTSNFSTTHVTTESNGHNKGNKKVLNVKSSLQPATNTI